MAKSLEEKYEDAAEAYRKDKSAAKRKTYHALRDELAERSRMERAGRGMTIVAESNEE